jgi:hypothetical protein
MQTPKAVIDENGIVRLPKARRALLTILDDEPKQNKRWSSNRELFDAINDAYKDDPDEEEKEFLRLAIINQSQILDEWK